MLDAFRWLLILIACLALPFVWGWFVAQLFGWLGCDRFLARAEYQPHPSRIALADSLLDADDAYVGDYQI